MNKFLLITLMAALTACGKDEPKPAENLFDRMTDPAFKAFCKKYDVNGDGILSAAEAESPKTMNIAIYSGSVNQTEISSLAGIEAFTALTGLQCSGNNLSTLDLSGNTKLQVLYCSGNNITSLNVSKNVALKKLYCVDNNISTLYVRRNKALTILSCHGNNLATLDVGKNTALETLFCGNQKSGTLTLTLSGAQKTKWDDAWAAAPANAGIVLVE